jgi:hypothetical protein
LRQAGGQVERQPLDPAKQVGKFKLCLQTDDKLFKTGGEN